MGYFDQRVIGVYTYFAKTHIATYCSIRLYTMVLIHKGGPSRLILISLFREISWLSFDVLALAAIAFEACKFFACSYYLGYESLYSCYQMPEHSNCLKEGHHWDLLKKIIATLIQEGSSLRKPYQTEI